MAVYDEPAPVTTSAPAAATAGLLRPAAAPSFLSRLRNRVAVWSDAETGRAFVWTPVYIGCGAGVYFGLAQEPPSWAAPLLVATLAIAAIMASGGRGASPARAAFAVALGFLAADVRTAHVEAPALAREMRPTDIVGRLVSLEEGASTRLIIAVETIEGLKEAETPERVRISLRTKADAGALSVAPGDRVTLRAGLSPPPPPAAPRAFDFARMLYFQRIGAVGYAVTTPAALENQPRGPGDRLRAGLERVRVAIARRIVEAAPGAGGAIVAAVVTGKRQAIPDEAEAALQDSGLAHLLAISGLHMGLATGIVFFALRALLARSETLALRRPIKKWAAAMAIAAGFVYLLLSGGGWSARRAFIMSAIVFTAILMDRRALSLRNVAIAATIVLLTTPEALFQPGFQMSFGAVTALIAGYEWMRERRADGSMDRTLGARLRRYAIGVAATDTISGLATAPYSLYHFNRAALYSLPANLASMPLMAFWIMPAAVIGLVLTPLGLDAIAWRVAALGMEAVLAVARGVSAQPGAVAMTPQWPLSTLLVLTFGGLWLCLQSAPWRLAGLIAAPVALALAALTPTPGVFVSRDGDSVAAIVMGADGRRRLAALDTRRNRFDGRVWRETAGVDPDRTELAPLGEYAACDLYGCVLPGRPRIAISTAIAGFRDDCQRADLVIATYPAPRRVTCAAEVLDRRAAWNDGAHAISIDRRRGALRIESAREARGDRPWTQEPRNSQAPRTIRARDSKLEIPDTDGSAD